MAEDRLTGAEKEALERMRRCFREYPDDVGLMVGTLDDRRCCLIVTRRPTEGGGYEVFPQAILLDDDLKNRIKNCLGELLPGG